MQVTVASVKGDGVENEDGVFVALPGCVAVLDGLSAPKDLPMACRHGTPWLVRQLGTRLVALGSDHDLPLASVLRIAIEEVNGLHADTCMLEQEAVPAATVVMLRERPEAFDYLVLSDSVLVLDTGSSVKALADSRVEDVAKTEMAAALAGPAGTPERTARVSELVARQRGLRNRPGGYWVASTAPEAADHAITGSIQGGDLRRAALLTDGASRLADLFHEATWEEVLDLLDQEGPSALLARVRAAERADNTGTRWPRFKVRDDATAAYAVVDPGEPSLH
ncbi:protein phosphatase 2C domain-containing protein [Streptomyces sp. ZAF1911]|uniref:protein phosphatase 2C domain-containing protein n=1 Tax=Streptomyces sp. ZAF1911 TaxID=2944129 RepID=UPI00237A366C|nr:protein phosphatase 2C domain-containing protein [Streptomyces sp. ZAF1911]MDD9383141.1 protein phosphatase 2C domain-containing protein [Streptomyces sp. ZAF1911]